jgi:hypothetical protein
MKLSLKTRQLEFLAASHSKCWRTPASTSTLPLTIKSIEVCGLAARTSSACLIARLKNKS